LKGYAKHPLGPLQIERDRGRVEGRAYYTLPADGVSSVFEQWPNLTTFGMSLSFLMVKGKELEMNYRYHTSSASLTELQLAKAVRGHWAIENNPHWVLDVSMGEDDCQIYQNHEAENLATLRQVALNMLRAEPSQLSIPRKQKRALIKTDYLEAVLKAGLTKMFEN